MVQLGEVGTAHIERLEGSHPNAPPTIRHGHPAVRVMDTAREVSSLLRGNLYRDDRRRGPNRAADAVDTVRSATAH